MLKSWNSIDDEDRFNVQLNQLSKAAFPALLTLYFTILLLWSWRKWPDILIDFGRELYVPWQISTGKILYKDISHIFGPLSQYANASLFYLFGPSYTLIILMNIIILALFLFLLYIIIKEACSELTAFICCAVVISIFSVSQLNGLGNTNFISPYSHEATHGILLSLIMMHQLWRFYPKQLNHYLVMAGFTFGLIFLTKVEIFFSALMVVVFFFFLRWLSCKDAKAIIRTTVIFFASSVIPLFVFGAYFVYVMPVNHALQAVLGSVINLFKTPGLANNKFYVHVMGFDDPISNLMTMVFHAIIVIVFLTAILFICNALKKHKDRLLFTLFLSMILFAIISLVSFVNPHEIGRPLPLLSFAAIVFLFYQYLKVKKKDQHEACRYIPVLLWSVFSIGMLWKMILFCRIAYYGFYLALPATVLIIVMLIWYVPEWFDTRYSGGSYFRIIMVIIMVIFSIKFLQMSDAFYKMKTLSVGFTGDRIVTVSPEFKVHGFITQQVVEWISAHVSHKETIVVLPEGVMINYLTRRVNPTPYINFMVPEMLIYGENTILDAFKKNPPDYFVIVHKDTTNYGFVFFGQDLQYGQRIMNWVNDFYFPIHQFGYEPLTQKKKFGIKIMKRNK